MNRTLKVVWFLLIAAFIGVCVLVYVSAGVTPMIPRPRTASLKANALKLLVPGNFNKVYVVVDEQARELDSYAVANDRRTETVAVHDAPMFLSVTGEGNRVLIDIDLRDKVTIQDSGRGNTCVFRE